MTEPLPRRGRRRYTDDEILDALRSCAERLGCSPTMTEFNNDPDAGICAQTALARFGSWNMAKRAAGLKARRHMTRDELVQQLQELAAELGRTPTINDIRERSGTRTIASPGIFYHAFGSVKSALREAGFEVLDDHQRLCRAIQKADDLAFELGAFPSTVDYMALARVDQTVPSLWQVYRHPMVKGRWSRFLDLVEEYHNARLRKAV